MGTFKLTGQSGGWLTGMLDCGNDRDDRWEATAKTRQGQDCNVVAYQMRLDGSCAGARFGFDDPGKHYTIINSCAGFVLPFLPCIQSLNLSTAVKAFECYSAICCDIRGCTSVEVSAVLFA